MNVDHRLRDRIKGAVAACRRLSGTHIRPLDLGFMCLTCLAFDGKLCPCTPFQFSRRKNTYDNTEEFWVEVRTTGSSAYQETLTETETHASQVVAAATWLHSSPACVGAGWKAHVHVFPCDQRCHDFIAEENESMMKGPAAPTDFASKFAHSDAAVAGGDKDMGEL